MADQFDRVVRAGGASCGVNGCLFGAVALFVILLVGLFIISIFRFSQPPAGPPGVPGTPPPSRSSLRLDLPGISVSKSGRSLAADVGVVGQGSRRA